jgi:TnpA family transposase
VVAPQDRPTGLARALAELGRIIKTLHMLGYIDSKEKRRRILTQLNRQEFPAPAGGYAVHTLDWIGEPQLRRETGQEPNKGEARNSLARAVFIHRLGEIRDRTYENQQHRASGLNLLVTAIILWNTRYLERAVAFLRQAEMSPARCLLTCRRSAGSM